MSPPHSHHGLAGVLLVSASSSTTDPPDVHTAATPRQGTEADGLVAGRQQHAPTQVNVAPTARA